MSLIKNLFKRRKPLFKVLEEQVTYLISDGAAPTHVPKGALVRLTGDTELMHTGVINVAQVVSVPFVGDVDTKVPEVGELVGVDKNSLEQKGLFA